MIDQMLRGSATTVPGRTAIAYRARHISYRELYEMVSAAGEGMRRHHVGKGDTVLMALHNCPEFVVAYFATAFIQAKIYAVDPWSTESELKSCVADCVPQFIITEARRAATFDRIRRELGGIPETIVVVDQRLDEYACFADFTECAGTNDRNWAHEPYAGEWSYAYSSGSTGTPKRICRTQANQVAEAANIAASAAVTASDVILCALPLFHALGQFCCMTVAAGTGATLVLLDRSTRADGKSGDALFPSQCRLVLDLIRTYRVTIMPAVPYIYDALADVSPDFTCNVSSLRLCLSGGNFLPEATAERFARRYGIPVRQTYGSSEAGSVSWDCRPAEEVTYGSVGTPLNNVNVGIVDGRRDPLPPGTIGEISVRSDAVMTGYVERPDLNRVALVDGWYFTGDLGMITDDGLLYVTGRKNLLIDTGGRKVNPIEVEVVLESHPQVQEAVVVGSPTPGGGEILTAVVVPVERFDPDELLRFSRDHLADYKVPRRFLRRDHLPRSSVGKVLRRELNLSDTFATDDEAPVGEGRRAGLDRVARNDELTTYLVRQVATLLRADPDQIDVKAPVSSIGLDSLMALQLQMTIENDLGVPGRLTELLDGSSFADIGRRLAEMAAGDVRPSPRSVSDRSGESPLSCDQLLIWKTQQSAPNHALCTHSFAMRVINDPNISLLHRCFRELSLRHPMLRTTVRLRNGVPVQCVAVEPLVDLQVVDAVGSADMAVLERLASDSRRTFDLELSAPLRVRVYTDLEIGAVVLVTVHNIGVDLWSLNILLHDLSMIYVAERDGTELYLPPILYTYADYVGWANQIADDPQGERDLRYWREQLRDFPPPMKLPGVQLRAWAPSDHGDFHVQQLGHRLTARLQRLAKAENVTLSSVIQASVTALLGHYTGTDDICLCVTSTTRRPAEFRNVIGCFTNVIILRTQLEVEPSFRDLLAHTHATLVDGLDHHAVPFPLLTERLGITQKPADPAVTSVVFVDHKTDSDNLAQMARFTSGALREQVSFGGTELESVPMSGWNVAYDLAIHLYRGGGSNSIVWEYNSDRLSRRLVQGFARDLEEFMVAAVDSPERSARSMTAESAHRDRMVR